MKKLTLALEVLSETKDSLCFCGILNCVTCQTHLLRQMGGLSLGLGPTKLYKHIISPKYNVRCHGNASFSSPYAKEESKLKVLAYLWTSC